MYKLYKFKKHNNTKELLVITFIYAVAPKEAICLCTGWVMDNRLLHVLIVTVAV